MLERKVQLRQEICIEQKGLTNDQSSRTRRQV
jgi:hypothetical protein